MRKVLIKFGSSAPLRRAPDGQLEDIVHEIDFGIGTRTAHDMTCLKMHLSILGRLGTKNGRTDASWIQFISKED